LNLQIVPVSLLPAMVNPRLLMLRSLLVGVRNQAATQAEIIALRHQLIVLQRTQKSKRLVLNRTDRCLWVWLISQLLPQRPSSSVPGERLAGSAPGPFCRRSRL